MSRARDLSQVVSNIGSSKVLYRQGGTGSVVRSLEGKLQESVSVLDFGADNTGATNVYDAVTKTIASFGSSAGTLEFPAGSYLMGTSKTFPSNVTVCFTGNSTLIVPSGVAVRFEGAVFSYGRHPFIPVSSVDFGTVTVGTNIESRSIYSGATDIEAQTFTQLTTGTQPVYKGAYGPTPNDAGVQFVAMNNEGVRKVFAAIQAQVESTTPGAEQGRLHFLVNDGDFSQVIGTINKDGSWILGPGIASYRAEIAGDLVNNPSPSGNSLLGERVSCADPDYDDARVLAIRNIKTDDLNSLTYRSGMGFTILNSAGKEFTVGLLRAQYSDRASGSEDTYMYPSTFVGGAETNGPYFYNNGISFNQALGESNKLDAYHEDDFTAQLTFGGASVGMTGTFIGQYTQIGNRAFGSGRVTLTAKGSSTGIARFALPIPAINNNRNAAAVPIFVITSVTTGTSVQGLVEVGASNVMLSKVVAGSLVWLTDADFANTSDFTFSFNYAV